MKFPPSHSLFMYRKVWFQRMRLQLAPFSCLLIALIFMVGGCSKPASPANAPSYSNATSDDGGNGGGKGSDDGGGGDDDGHGGKTPPPPPPPPPSPSPTPSPSPSPTSGTPITTASTTGTYNILIRGDYYGSATASVSSSSVSLSGTVCDSSGSKGAVSLTSTQGANNHFFGSGSILGASATFSGRVDAPDSSGQGKVLVSQRLVVTIMTTTGKVARGAGHQ